MFQLYDVWYDLPDDEMESSSSGDAKGAGELRVTCSGSHSLVKKSMDVSVKT